MHSRGFSTPSRSTSVCSGTARWLRPAAVITALRMRKESSNQECTGIRVSSASRIHGLANGFGREYT